MNDLETLRAQVLSLPVVDRERLMMEDLLDSIDPGAREAMDRVWADEIESRSKAYQEGRIGTVTQEVSRRRLGL